VAGTGTFSALRAGELACEAELTVSAAVTAGTVTSTA
jgi:hypothetical protein